MSLYRFHDPWVLSLLLALPLLLWRRRERLAALRYSAVAPLKALRTPRPRVLAAILPALRFAALALLILALARPQAGHKSTEILSLGVDIILTLDTSGSMNALDFVRDGNRVTRLSVVQEVAREFVAQRPYDRLGMVVFGEEAFTQCPLTLDHNILLGFLDKMHVGMAGQSTAIGSAIGVSVKRLKDLKAKSRVIILLTDGQSNAGNIQPLQAAEIAKTFGVKIYTIGVGTQGRAPILVDGPFGKQTAYIDADLDEETLQAIATATGGRYFRAADRETLKNVYAQIDRLEKSEAKVIDRSSYTELFPRFAVPAFVLMLLEILLSQTLLRRIP